MWKLPFSLMADLFVARLPREQKVGKLANNKYKVNSELLFLKQTFGNSRMKRWVLSRKYRRENTPTQPKVLIHVLRMLIKCIYTFIDMSIAWCIIIRSLKFVSCFISEHYSTRSCALLGTSIDGS